jgi:CheY-like chemotaxis protein
VVNVVVPLSIYSGRFFINKLIEQKNTQHHATFCDGKSLILIILLKFRGPLPIPIIIGTKQWEVVVNARKGIPTEFAETKENTGMDPRDDDKKAAPPETSAKRSDAKTATSVLPVRIKLYGTILTVAVVIVSMFLLGKFGMDNLSGLRAFVGAEGLWSKCQKTGSHHLLSYAYTRDESDYEMFHESQEILFAMKRLRLELEKPEPDLNIVYEGFRRLGVHGKDMEIMATLFRRFRHFEHVAKAIDIWGHADEYVAKFQVFGTNMHQLLSAGGVSQKKMNELTSEIERLDHELSELEQDFSFALGDASRWAKGLLTVVMILFTIIAGAICMGLLLTVSRIIEDMHRSSENLKEQNWVQSGQAALNEQMSGEQDEDSLAGNIMRFVADYLNIQIGAIYINDKDNVLKLVSSYAYTKRKSVSDQFKFGEGVVGQAALQKQPILLTTVPENHITVSSGFGEALPRNILVQPFIFEGQVKGVLELGTLDKFTDLQRYFLKHIAENIAIAINSAEIRFQMQMLLEELQAQQEELKQANEELEEQTEILKESEGRLQTQQEELKQTNEELEEQTQLLEEQKTTVQQKNLDLENAQKSLEDKAEELELSSKYKSEFLANMSHELRTPLNSIQLLSRLMADNKDGNLTEKQVEFSRTINSSGSDLMSLINEVLDLSKVEAGKMELQLEDISLQDIALSMERNFQPVAQEKRLSLKIDLAESLPLKVRTDRQRIEQIIRNLLSNAFKFTSQGTVTLSIGRCTHQVDLSRSGLDPEKAIAVSVSDTGVGVPKNKQKVIFEAFQQSDGTTSRQFGGTGLGLSISRELAKLLGGEIVLESEEGKGSIFTLYLPETLKERREEQRAESRGHGVEQKKESIPYVPRSKHNVEQGDRPESSEFIPDDRKEISPDDKSILIIEDDCTFAKTLADLSREKGFKVLVAEDGETGLYLADYYKPSAIVLDYGLPGMDGGAVISKLRDNPYTRHIPVHFISASDRKSEVMKMGVVGYLTKPVSVEALGRVYETIEHTISTRIRTLLIVEDDENQRKAISELIGNGDIMTTGVATGKEAQELLQSKTFDCIIMDLGLPDMSGVELLTRIRENEDAFHTPVIVYTGRDLTREEETTLNQYAESIIIKGSNSLEMLLDKATLFLHHVVANLPEEQKGANSMTHDKESILKGKKILLVDDDMRNVFAITNTLEERGMQIMVGKNGKEALEYLEKNPDVDLVLMDVMMPEMDGYEASKEIRKQARFKDLPIIALTAKAMKGDRAKCIEAGSSDYLAKPVDAEKLLSMMRVWLY